jgi:serine/threonine-protein kinase
MENSLIGNRYRVLQQIGAGGFGFTYLGEDLGFPQRPRCVIKLLRPQARDAASLTIAGELFQQEAETLYRLGRHPNIPALIAHFRDRGEFFLVQEFIEGHTLDREFLGGKRYDQHEVIQFLGQVLETLSFVHGERVIHRDVKPANLIRRVSDGGFALIDFGAVKRVSSAGDDGTVAIGSHGYMPVEQMAGNPNFSSDLFALGLVAIEALSGVKPLDIPKDPRTQEFLWTSRNMLSPDVQRFVSTLTRRNARERFVSAKEALAALNSIAANVGFFNARPAASVAAAPLHYAPSPVEIPPTVIVSPQQRLIRQPLPQPEKHGDSALVNSGSQTAKLIVVGAGLIAITLAVLNFATFFDISPAEKDQMRSSWRKAPKETPTSVPLSPKVDAYNEAVEQAREALAKETGATTRFEWEEIANKYRRAYLLFGSVGGDHPKFDEAQRNIDHYKTQSERARAKSLTLPRD